MIGTIIEVVRSPLGRTRVIVGLVLAAVFCFQCQRALRDDGAQPGIIQPTASVSSLAIADEPVGPAKSDDPDYVAIGRDDPLKLLRLALHNYQRQIRDYTCTFSKLERIGGKLTKEQVIEVKFREKPFSVMMYWIKNPGKAERVIYVKGANDGKAVVAPAGAIAKLFVRSIKQPIDGVLAKRASRRQIDQFGFARAMELAIEYYVKAQEEGDVGELLFAGETKIADRPAIKLVRKLPDHSDYPDQTLEAYIDTEWLLPTCLRCLDGNGALLGQYFYTDVLFNVGLTDKDFDPKTYGM